MRDLLLELRQLESSEELVGPLDRQRAEVHDRQAGDEGGRWSRRHTLELFACCRISQSDRQYLGLESLPLAGVAELRCGRVAAPSDSSPFAS